MATRSDIEAQIADDLARSDLTTQISNGVNAAIRAYRYERLGFNERYRYTAIASSGLDYLTFDIVAGGDGPALPTTRFRKIDRIRIVRDTGNYIDLYRRDYDWIASRQDAGAVSMPMEYAVYNDKILFDCAADQQYDLLIDGIVELATNTSLSYSAADATAWFNEARELVRHRAKREVYAHVLKDMELASAAAAAEKEAYDMLKSELGELATTGAIRPTEF